MSLYNKQAGCVVFYHALGESIQMEPLTTTSEVIAEPHNWNHVHAYRNRKPCNSFFMVSIASSMDCGCVRLRKKDDVAQRGGHTLANRSTQACSLGL